MTMVKKIDRFRGKYYFLSNFFICNVEYENLTYTNTEAAFQAQKSLDTNIKRKFTDLDPLKAKRLGRRIDLRDDWNEIRDEVMYNVCMAKFSQNDDLRKSLIDTGDATLIEGNPWNDRYWGMCKGKGKNKLGKILMKIRDELKNE